MSLVPANITPFNVARVPMRDAKLIADARWCIWTIEERLLMMDNGLSQIGEEELSLENSISSSSGKKLLR